MAITSIPLKGDVYLTENQYQTLKTNGSIVINGQTILYDNTGATRYITDQPEIVMDSEMSNTSINPVRNNVIKKYVDDEVAKKQTKLTAGTNITISSSNVISAVANGSFVKTEIYDNTTLGDHIEEIIGYTNNENGGILLKIGFKLGTTAISGTRKNVSVATDTGTITVTEATGTIMNAGEFVYMTPGALRSGATSGKKVTFICANDTDLHSNSNIDISNVDGTNSVTISGQEFGYMPTSIDTIYYVNVDIMNASLEHLTIDHYVV